MSDTITIPRAVWEQVVHDLSFLKKAILPLAAGYKPAKWMTADEVMQALNIGVSRLKQLRASGQIRYQKAGRYIEYLRTDIEDYKCGNIIITSNKKTGCANNRLS